jgi:hypothetical protein
METRKSGIARKLLAVCLVFSLPIVVMFVLMTRAKLGEIEFASKELASDAYQRPLEEALEHLSRHHRLLTRLRGGDLSVTAQLCAADLAMYAAKAAGRNRLFVDEQAADSGKASPSPGEPTEPRSQIGSGPTSKGAWS